MEILILYLFIGFIISSMVFIISDQCPWILFFILCISWIPFIFLGTVTASFMDIKRISNRANI